MGTTGTRYARALWQKWVTQLKEANDTGTGETCEIRLEGRR